MAEDKKPAATTPATATSVLPATVPSTTPTRQEIQAARTAGLPEVAQRMIEERRAIVAVSNEIANLSWGKGLNDKARRALAEYCRRWKIDAASEVDILGGKLYRNAAYFIRRGVELRRRGLIENIVVEHINDDPRLKGLAAETANEETRKRCVEELERRAWFRIQHNVPEGVKGAVMVSILPKDGAPVVGVNYAGSFGSKKDPIGDGDPGKTAETRAYRRAWRHLVDTMPGIKAEMGEIEEEGKELSGFLLELAEDEADRSTAATIEHKPMQQLNAGDPNDPYAVKQGDAVAAKVDDVDPFAPASVDEERRQQEEIRRQDLATLEADRIEAERRAGQGGLPLGDRRPNRSAQSQGR